MWREVVGIGYDSRLDGEGQSHAGREEAHGGGRTQGCRVSSSGAQVVQTAAFGLSSTFSLRRAGQPSWLPPTVVKRVVRRFQVAKKNQYVECLRCYLRNFFS